MFAWSPSLGLRQIAQSPPMWTWKGGWSIGTSASCRTRRSTNCHVVIERGPSTGRTGVGYDSHVVRKVRTGSARLGRGPVRRCPRTLPRLEDGQEGDHEQGEFGGGHLPRTRDPRPQHRRRRPVAPVDSDAQQREQPRTYPSWLSLPLVLLGVPLDFRQRDVPAPAHLPGLQLLLPRLVSQGLGCESQPFGRFVDGHERTLRYAPRVCQYVSTDASRRSPCCRRCRDVR